jgi:hypothetical protein
VNYSFPMICPIENIARLQTNQKVASSSIATIISQRGRRQLSLQEEPELCFRTVLLPAQLLKEQHDQETENPISLSTHNMPTSEYPFSLAISTNTVGGGRGRVEALSICATSGVASSVYESRFSCSLENKKIPATSIFKFLSIWLHLGHFAMLT